jgi:hypothetical protein
LVGYPERKRHSEDPGVEGRKMAFKGMNWNSLVQNRGQEWPQCSKEPLGSGKFLSI